MSAGPWGRSTKHLSASPLQWEQHKRAAPRVGYSLEIPRASSGWIPLGLLGVGRGTALSPLNTPTGALFACCKDQCSGAVPTASSYPTCPTEASHGRWPAERTTGSLSSYVLAAKQMGFVARGTWGSSACLQGNMDVRRQLLGFRSSWEVEPGVELVRLS